MRELKLKYVLDLVSNIGARSKADAKALAEAQAAMQAAITGTNNKFADYGKLSLVAGRNTSTMQEVITGATNKFAALDRAMSRVGANTALQRQMGYAQHLARAYEAASAKAAALARVGAGVASKGMQIGTGVAAGGAVASAMLRAPLDYDSRLRAVTATAFAGQDLAGLRTGYGRVNSLVNDAVRATPGATRDATLGAFEKLVGSGSFSFEESSALLPKIMRTSVASGADANELVQVAEKMRVSLDMLPDQIEVGLAKVMRAGQEGGFEIKDSAKWIPQLLPQMGGYKGMDAVEQVVTMLQQVRSTAGTNDEAANNLRNFLQKMGADSTRAEFQKKHGIDLNAEMAAGMAKGQTPVDTYMGIFDRLIAKADPEGKAREAMKAADGATSPDERQQRYEAIRQRYAGSEVATIINDLQEFGGYEGLRRTGDYGRRVLDAVRAESGGAVSTGFDFVSEGGSAKATAVAMRKEIAASDAFERAAPAFNTMLDAVTKLADEYPATTTAIVAATGALGVFTAALGAGSVAAMIAARGASIAGAGGAAGTAAAGVAGASRLAKLGGVLGVVGAGHYAFGEVSRLGSAVSDLYKVKTREGVTLTPEAQARLAAMEQGASGRGVPTAGSAPANDWLTLSQPGGAGAKGPLMPAAPDLKIGDGRLDVVVRVEDGRATATSTVARQPSLVRLDNGATNPGSLPAPR